MRQNVLCFSVSVSFSIFSYNSTRVHQHLTTNWRPGGPDPLIQIWQPVYMYNLGEIKGFCPKNCNVRHSHNFFYEHNAITSAEFTKWHSARCPVLRWYDVYLVFTYIWQEDVVNILKLPKAPRNVNPSRAITFWQVGLSINYTIFQQHFLPLC